MRHFETGEQHRSHLKSRPHTYAAQLFEPASHITHSTPPGTYRCTVALK